MNNNVCRTEAITFSPSSEEVARSIAVAYRDLGEKLKMISEEEIRARNRVNLSVNEYEHMKHRIASLESEVDYLRSILEKIEAPLDKNIIPDSIRTYYSDGLWDCKRVFRVEFAIENWELK